MLLMGCQALYCCQGGCYDASAVQLALTLPIFSLNAHLNCLYALHISATCECFCCLSTKNLQHFEKPCTICILQLTISLQPICTGTNAALHRRTGEEIAS